MVGPSSACADSANTTGSRLPRRRMGRARRDHTRRRGADHRRHKMTALRMIQRGDIKGRQVCKGAPWVIKAEDVAAFGAGKRSKSR